MKLIPLTFSVVCLITSITLYRFKCILRTAIESILCEGSRMLLTSDTLHCFPSNMREWAFENSTVNISICEWARKVAAKTVILVIWKHLMNGLYNCGTLTFHSNGMHLVDILQIRFSVLLVNCICHRGSSVRRSVGSNAIQWNNWNDVYGWN